MSSFDCTKNKKLWFALSALIAVAGLVCALALGVSDVDFTGRERSVAAFSEEFDPESADLDINALTALAEEKAGAGATARVLKGYTTAGSSLELSYKNGSAPDLAAVKAAINETYPDAGLSDFTSSKLAAGKFLSSALVVLGCFALAWLAVWITAVFAVGRRDSLLVLLGAVHDSLITFAVFVALRAGSVKALIACGLIAVALSAYFNIIKLSRLNTALGTKKNDRNDAIAAVSGQLAARSATYLAFAALPAAGIVIASLALGESAAIPFAILAFAALVTGVYSSACITPNLWSMRKK